MRKIWSSLLFVALILSAQTRAFAWDDTGHMLVSTIAYNRLNPTAKARVDALMKVMRYCGKNYDGQTVGVWMDDIKSDFTHDDIREWHYTNLPIFDGIPADPSVKALDNNVVTRLTWTLAMLRKGTGSDKKDAELLGYVFHLVGDIHQPMHAATRFSAANMDGDAGGNEFKIITPEASQLHYFWDAAAGSFHFWSPPRPFDNFTQPRLSSYVQNLTTLYPPTVAEVQVVDPAKWADESHQLARTVAYALPENSKPSNEYTAKAQATAQRRITLAGYRLAQVLNSIYPDAALKD